MDPIAAYLARHWMPWPPLRTSRVLVVREVGSQRYVDVIAYVQEPDSGLPERPSHRGCTHYMPLPALPDVPGMPEPASTCVWINGEWCPLDSDGDDV